MTLVLIWDSVFICGSQRTLWRLISIVFVLQVAKPKPSGPTWPIQGHTRIQKKMKEYPKSANWVSELGAEILLQTMEIVASDFSLVHLELPAGGLHSACTAMLLQALCNPKETHWLACSHHDLWIFPEDQSGTSWKFREMGLGRRGVLFGYLLLFCFVFK